VPTAHTTTHSPTHAAHTPSNFLNSRIRIKEEVLHCGEHAATLQTNRRKERAQRTDKRRQNQRTPLRKARQTHTQRALGAKTYTCKGERGRQSKCGKRPLRSWQGCRMETKGRVAESTARTTFAVVVHPNNTIREPACTAGVHPSHAHNNRQACRHTCVTNQASTARRRTTTRPLPRTTAVDQDKKGWLTNNPFRARLGTTADAAKSASTLQKEALATF
jgi:hypothetical protein